MPPLKRSSRLVANAQSAQPRAGPRARSTLDVARRAAAVAKYIESLERDTVPVTADTAVYSVADDDNEQVSANAAVSKPKSGKRKRAADTSSGSGGGGGIVSLEDWIAKLGYRDADATSLSTMPNYITVRASLPAMHLCSVCGFLASYACSACVARFCSIHCQRAHQDTEKCSVR